MTPVSAILLTGATGYIGGKLLARLESSGRQVRCLARRPELLTSKASRQTEVVRGDVLDASSLPAAMQGVRAAYYLVHSMGSGAEFEEQDRTAAQNFATAARDAGVERIIYLGGLGSGDELSRHLQSRHETGDVLRGAGVPVIELRASIVIGSGSLSFEMVRALVERLPIMVTPRWVRSEAQPIAIEDVISYLLAALDLPAGVSRIFEIGGADRVSYGDIMREYARQRGLRRLMIPVPLLTPHLSSLWLGLVTPVHARVGRQIVDSLRNSTVVHDPSAMEVFSVRPVGMRQAIARALAAPSSTQIVDSRSVWVAASPEDAFRPIRRIGGQTGWYYGTWLWRLRGAIDLMTGGVGLRRGRSDPEWPAVGGFLDFWRVEACEPGRKLRLEAEMRVPGKAWLEFEVEPDGAGSIIRQTAIFDPRGVGGLLYWYVLYPAHRLIFRGMLRALARAATGRGIVSSTASAPALAPSIRHEYHSDRRD